jgi:hypothetical protein
MTRATLKNWYSKSLNSLLEHSDVATNLADPGTDIQIGHLLHKMMELLNLP